MIRYLKVLILLKAIFLLCSCGLAKEGFTNQKKNNSEEFLVEKKNPLVMPPDYNELPDPKIIKDQNKENENSIKSLLKDKDQLETDLELDNKDQKLEDSLLEKIKNN
tara:strand:+ start:402 stop:722 length:321 start_codon:yes stop_codon:yes gene_type:complete